MLMEKWATHCTASAPILESLKEESYKKFQFVIVF